MYSIIKSTAKAVLIGLFAYTSMTAFAGSISHETIILTNKTDHVLSFTVSCPAGTIHTLGDTFSIGPYQSIEGAITLPKHQSCLLTGRPDVLPQSVWVRIQLGHYTSRCATTLDIGCDEGFHRENGQSIDEFTLIDDGWL